MPDKNLFIGTSGWNYQDWQGIFYPADLSSKEYLKFYSRYFNTVEINSSFYHFPKDTTYKNWYCQVPDNFIFSVKVHRSITHIKRLSEIEKEWWKFINGAKILGRKLGVILFQFPASFRYNVKNLERIENFFSLSKDEIKISFEFRHASWDNEKICELLKRYNAGWVIANSSRYPEMENITADFVYMRMHGPQELFASEYSENQLKELSSKIKIWRKTKEVFVYFNNDFYGYAVKNAGRLVKLCKE
ncbi:MAG: DUF72 domain-containing protein [bacterium]|nr:DUF72 domain-containing protein [bacterium]